MLNQHLGSLGMERAGDSLSQTPILFSLGGWFKFTVKAVLGSADGSAWAGGTGKESRSQLCSPLGESRGGETPKPPHLGTVMWGCTLPP